MTRPLYVETRVRADLDRLWHATQDADAHTRWDLRFSRIEDVTAQTDTGARTFPYALQSWTTSAPTSTSPRTCT